MHDIIFKTFNHVLSSPRECNHKIHGKLIHHKPARAIEGKEIVKVCEGNVTRYLIVPSREPTDPPGIFSKSEMERLQKQAEVKSTFNYV